MIVKASVSFADLAEALRRIVGPGEAPRNRPNAVRGPPPDEIAGHGRNATAGRRPDTTAGPRQDTTAGRGPDENGVRTP